MSDGEEVLYVNAGTEIINPSSKTNSTDKILKNNPHCLCQSIEDTLEQNFKQPLYQLDPDTKKTMKKPWEKYWDHKKRKFINLLPNLS